MQVNPIFVFLVRSPVQSLNPSDFPYRAGQICRVSRYSDRMVMIKLIPSPAVGKASGACKAAAGLGKHDGEDAR